VHLLDPETGQYNTPFLSDELVLVPGYRRMQGVVTRFEETRDVAGLLGDRELRMVNRNRGSGTRVLIDELLGELRPDGHAYEPRSHNAVAAAVAQGRADWGVTVETVALEAGLRFRPLREEHYDFAVPASRRERPAVRLLCRLLEPDGELRRELAARGFQASS
jgi:putative molybdopterin biosynthesis protein